MNIFKNNILESFTSILLLTFAFISSYPFLYWLVFSDKPADGVIVLSFLLSTALFLVFFAFDIEMRS